MASSPSPSPRLDVRLRRAPTGVRGSHMDSSSSSTYFSAAPLSGLLSLSNASRLPVISLQQRPLVSPFAGRSRLSSAVRSSADPGEVNVLLFRFYFAPAPGRMGYAAAVERFLKLMAMVWAGSQVTKVFRAGGALALAPFVDRGLRWFTVKFNFKSEGRFKSSYMSCIGFATVQAFATIVVMLMLAWNITRCHAAELG
ncbi:hypothetical protein PR202_gb22496 [Eleusine coracana subsp. coracana]|uniref:Uncharacterized protein n=1 Tax=Eleusine coracana subsp. coracana TaxID=191504 RepID=A0AAV5FDX0_ELECO|nr:hypothetical protein PR202_gb22496 [Eleusine coracana subsp. coracana]